MQASSHSCRSYVHLTDFDIHEEHDLLRWKLETAKGGGCSGLPPVIGTASGTVCFVGACCLQNVSCQGAPLGCPSSRRRILSCAILLGFRPAQACTCLHKLAVKASHASAPCCRPALHIAGRLRHLQCRCRHLQHWVCMPDAKHGVRSAVRMPRHWPVQELCCVGAQGPAAGHRCSRGARCMSQAMQPCSCSSRTAVRLLPARSWAAATSCSCFRDIWLEPAGSPAWQGLLVAACRLTHADPTRAIFSRVCVAAV